MATNAMGNQINILIFSEWQIDNSLNTIVTRNQCKFQTIQTFNTSEAYSSQTENNANKIINVCLYLSI